MVFYLYAWSLSMIGHTKIMNFIIPFSLPPFKSQKQYTMALSIYWYNWADSRQNQQNECAPSEDSDQPGQLPNLISLRCPHEESFGP